VWWGRPGALKVSGSPFTNSALEQLRVLPLGGAVVGVAGWNITIDSGDVKVRHTVGS
jgi:hypothetical protein